MENNRHDSKSLGFTLLEMIIVVGILAITATIGIAVLDPMTQIQKANDARIKADFSQIQKALEQYYDDSGKYPISTGFKITNSSGSTVNWGDTWQPYMNLVPKSPYSTSNYVYYSPTDSSGQSYYLYANLARGTDENLCNGGDACDSLPLGASCGGVVCNYGVSSQNVSP